MLAKVEAAPWKDMESAKNQMGCREYPQCVSSRFCLNDTSTDLEAFKLGRVKIGRFGRLFEKIQIRWENTSKTKCLEIDQRGHAYNAETDTRHGCMMAATYRQGPQQRESRPAQIIFS